MAAPPDADAGTEELIDELLSDPGYADGTLPFPRKVTLGEALAVQARVHAEIDGATEVRAQAAAAEGVTIACKRGCSICCSEPIMVFAPEALAVTAFLVSPSGEAARTAFRAAYPAWKGQVGPSLNVLRPLDGSVTFEEREAAHLALHRRHIPCPFLVECACSIYPARPGLCRNGHAIETGIYCGADHPSGKAAKRLAFVPLDDFMRLIWRLERALHVAIGAGPNALSPLPDLVNALLPPD